MQTNADKETNGSGLSAFVRGFVRVSLRYAVVLPTATMAQDATRTEITGIVRDVRGVVVDGAEVALDKSTIAALSSPSGLYRLTGVPTGPHTIVVRKLGYTPTRTEVRVAGGEVKLDLTIMPLPVEMMTVRSRETHVGLTGMIVDSLDAPLAGAMIRAYTGQPQPDTLRSHQAQRSDTEGGFFLPLPPGHYTLQVSSAGLRPSTVVVFVPLTGGRCIVVKVGTRDRGKQLANCVRTQ